MRLDANAHTVTLTGDEIATAIDAYLVAHRVYVGGPRTITVAWPDDEDERWRRRTLFRGAEAQVYVDPIDGTLHSNGDDPCSLCGTLGRETCAQGACRACHRSIAFEDCVSGHDIGLGPGRRS